MNQNSTPTQSVQDGVHHSKPIPISTQHLRHRSTSFSSEFSNSPASSPPLPTPKNFSVPLISKSPPSPTLYFLSQSPSKAPATFPFRGFPPPPVPEDDISEEHPPHRITRRDSVASRFQPQPSMPELHHERGVNLLRRLSLGNQLGKPPPVDIPQPSVPQTPPNSAVASSPSVKNILPGRKLRLGRSATVTEQARPRRAPSPMAERILKGHFDGFN